MNWCLSFHAPPSLPYLHLMNWCLTVLTSHSLVSPLTHTFLIDVSPYSHLLRWCLSLLTRYPKYGCSPSAFAFRLRLPPSFFGGNWLPRMQALPSAWEFLVTQRLLVILKAHLILSAISQSSKCISCWRTVASE
jgi:hypothetical protein